jgi:hypothetical protein
LAWLIPADGTLRSRNWICERLLDSSDRHLAFSDVAHVSDPSDDNLYVKRWNQILDAAFDPEMVQIISWNDYGESHCASFLLPVEGLVAD